MPKRIVDDFDPPRFFRKGESFFYTATHMMRQPREVMVPSNFAMIVCYAFACEVYLKVLMSVERGLKPLKTHNLKFLFADLTDGAQSHLRDRWTAECLPGIMEGYRSAPMPAAIVIPQSFDQALENSSGAFVDWRYSTEPSTPLYFHLIDLVPMVREVILEKHPDWQASFRRGPTYPVAPPDR